MRDASEASVLPALDRLIFESSLEGIVVTDDIGRVLQANRAAREFLLADIERVLRGGEPAEPAIKAFRAELRGSGAALVELRLTAADGSVRSVSMAAKRHGTNHLLFLRDTTERERLEQELVRLRRVDSVDVYTNGVVRELGDVLAPLGCLSALLTEELGPSSRASGVARELYALADRASELARQILLVAVSTTPSGRELPRGSETIMVVEDDDHVRTVVRTVLEEQGYGVVDAASGELALKEIAQHDRKIDLLLVDAILPGMNGRALLNRLRGLGHAVKVLFMSGHTDQAIAEHGVCDPEDPLLRKAFSPAVLVRKVREVLGDAPSSSARSSPPWRDGGEERTSEER